MLTTASSADDTEHHHARRYSLLTARYQSPDPIGGNPFAPQSWNLFAYVEGNPMNFIDRFGLDPDCVKRETGKDGTEGDCSEVINVLDTVPPVGPGGNNSDRRDREERGTGRDRDGRERQRCAGLPRETGTNGYRLSSTLSTLRDLRNLTSTAPGPLARSGGFALLVGATAFQTGAPNGAWNFKRRVRSCDPNFNAFEAYGNFHFGAVSRTLGMPLGLTLSFAGFVEAVDDDGEIGPASTFFEPEDDYREIEMGWLLAECY